ncbi:zinc ABC transporter substrate-binding protein [Paracoccus sp. M683]|nr:zinc ABC transporter substrate-binding protein [Paracoccus sp. M683]
MSRPATMAFALTGMTALTALTARAEPPLIVTDIPATGSLVQQVLGDLGDVQVLLPAGGNAHHYQLRPSQAASLQDAGLLIWVGPELTPWLARAAESLTQGVSLPLLALPQTQHPGGTAEDHDHAAHDHDHEHDTDDHDQDHGGIDPHAWLDPQNGKLWLAAIAEALAKADPEHAATYTENARLGAQQIDQTSAALTAELASVAGQRFAVFHDAYGHFTGRFGLQPAIALALGDAATPSAARLSAIRDEMLAGDIRCIFPETGHDPAVIESLIDGTDIRIGDMLDPAGASLVTGNGTGDKQLYPAILQGLGQTITGCLSSE